MVDYRHRIALVVAAALLTAPGCAAPPLDIAESRAVPMNRVYPYPTDEDRGRAISTVLVKGASLADLGRVRADAALGALERHFISLLQRNGARVVAEDARYTLRAEIADYDYEASWKRPTNWRFQSDEEMKVKPGKCAHRVDARLVVSILDGTGVEPLHSFTLDRSAEGESESLDPACPYSQAEQEALLLTALSESLPCVHVPIVNFFAPRGYLVERRRPLEGGYDVFRSTLMPAQVPADASSIGVYRVQLSTASDGTRVRDEHRIAEARLVPGAVNDAGAWLEVDLERAEREPLDGDVVRPVVGEGAISSLNPWGLCDSALADN